MSGWTRGRNDPGDQFWWQNEDTGARYSCDAGGWIDAAMHMPPPGKPIEDEDTSEVIPASIEVLVATSAGGRDVDCRLPDRWLGDYGHRWWRDGRVTHWQPLPESPTAPSAPGVAP